MPRRKSRKKKKDEARRDEPWSRRRVTTTLQILLLRERVLTPNTMAQRTAEAHQAANTTQYRALFQATQNCAFSFSQSSKTLDGKGRHSRSIYSDVALVGCVTFNRQSLERPYVMVVSTFFSSRYRTSLNSMTISNEVTGFKLSIGYQSERAFDTTFCALHY